MQSDKVSAGNNTRNEESPADEPRSIGKWHSWAVTDIGKQRKRNEDAVLNKPEAGVWAVADGMGGHDAGDIASQLIVDSLESIFSATNLKISIEQVDNCLQSVNTHLRSLAEQSQKNAIIGSTVVVLIAQQQRCAVLWAGDSRLYRLRNHQLQQLTQDHCPNYGNIANEWAVKSSNEITRAVGADEELDLDCEITDVHEGDMFLLCSDGLDKEISPKEIEQVLLNQEPEKIVGTLLELALERGARDNVSIVLAVPHKNG